MVGLLHGGRVLVTGASGFVGRILMHALRKRGYEAVGIANSKFTKEMNQKGSAYYEFDLASAPWLITNFDAVVHLAGLAQVGPSFEHPQRYITTNSSIMTNLCEPLVADHSSARVVVVSSGAVYGGGHAKPLAEDAAVELTSPYAVSKALVENQAAYYRARGLDTVVARPFNHIGPGQGPGFVVPDLATKLKRASKNGESVEVGNLDASRDYTDVRDVAAAYIALLETEHLHYAVYNIASGESHTGWEILDLLASQLKLSVPAVQISQSRALDPSKITGDPSRLISETGWHRQWTLTDSIRDFIHGNETLGTYLGER